ncbi:MAG: hypothetical protein PHH00_04245 [Candidatus Nanoarchaeia archaeon]|nr:hypothetical protein [Candidatus Nanoarchaeia archaeon]
MQKSGQIFLIAAFIIAGLIISVSAVYISIRAPKENTKVYDLSQELNEETAQVINYGMLSGNAGVQANIRSLSEYYAKAYPDSEIAIVYGTAGEAAPSLAVYFPCSEGNISLESAGVQTCIKETFLKEVPLTSTDYQGSKLEISGSKATITLKGKQYITEIPPERNYFYIIVKNIKQGQQTVVTSK